MKKKALVCLLVCLFFVPSAWGWKRGDKIRVLDWNVYIGTDVFAVVQGLISVDDAVDQIIDSDIISRAKTISKHIKILKPHVVFMQEVWQVAIVDLVQGSTEVYDFLAVFEAELDNYIIAGVHELTNLPLPYQQSGYVNVLDRDVVLVRKDVEVLPGGGNQPYPEEILLKVVIETPDGPFEVISKRGYTTVKALIHGNPYLLVNPHLEVFPPFREAQAAQLAAEIGVLTDTVILGGDFNDEPGTDTYTAMTDAGFIDRWNDRKFRWWDDGYTCCQDADLRNRFSHLYQQIDFVYTLNGNFKTISGRVIGDRWYNKTRTHPRLWPSDHGGLIFLLYNR
jgi:hypothetical protein